MVYSRHFQGDLSTNNLLWHRIREPASIAGLTSHTCIQAVRQCSSAKLTARWGFTRSGVTLVSRCQRAAGDTDTKPMHTDQQALSCGSKDLEREPQGSSAEAGCQGQAWAQVSHSFSPHGCSPGMFSAPHNPTLCMGLCRLGNVWQAMLPAL